MPLKNADAMSLVQTSIRKAADRDVSRDKADVFAARLALVRQLGMGGDSNVVTAGEFLKIYNSDFRTPGGKKVKMNDELTALKPLLEKMPPDTPVVKIALNGLEEMEVYCQWLGRQ